MILIFCAFGIGLCLGLISGIIYVGVMKDGIVDLRRENELLQHLVSRATRH